LQTFKLVDQLSGRTLGLRADMTPQVARIDAHLLNRTGVTRLCYAGPIAHTRTPIGCTSREELQLGAEIYGHAGWEADLEALTLLLQTLQTAGLKQVYLDLSHAGILTGILENQVVSKEEIETLYGLLQSKDRSSLASWSRNLPQPVGQALMALTELSGPAKDVLVKARKVLPSNALVSDALSLLERLTNAIALMTSAPEVSIDLADLRGYQYHSGMMFTAYVDALPQPIARGGRYDHVGQAFGRARPATGFSIDLLTLAGLSTDLEERSAILAPWISDAGLNAAIQALRAGGEIVVQLAPGDAALSAEYRLDRVLVEQGGTWKVQPKSASKSS
jgi:ATP phosphoribosyltransferase regulatory subunit